MIRDGVIEHARGTGRCGACGGKDLRTCHHCNSKTLHNVRGDDICERGCSQRARTLESAEREFRLEMAAALAEFEAEYLYAPKEMRG